MWKTKTTAQSTSDFSPKHQTPEISFKTSDLMLKHQKWQHCLSASLRNKSCKRLGSRPSRSITLSIKPCLPLLIFSRGTLIIHQSNKWTVVLIRLQDNLLKQGSYAILKINIQTFSRHFMDFFQT